MRRFPEKGKLPGLIFKALTHALTLAACCALICGLLVAALGFFPVPGSGGRAGPDGIAIAVCGTETHSDFVLPANAAGTEGLVDWTALFPPAPGDDRPPNFVTIGWGQREFFLTTPTWSDLTLGATLRAALGGPSALRVYYERALPPEGRWCRRVTLSPSQYAALAAYIRRETRLDARGASIPVPARLPGYSGTFYEGSGLFHAFKTCNTWTAGGLKAAGLPAPLWTPLAYFVFYHLP